MPLTPADVHNVAFSKPPIGKRGYNEDEVDAFLDLVENELTRLVEETSDRDVDGSAASERVLAMAQEKADAIQADAERKHSEIMGTITQQRVVLEGRLEQLRTFEQEYRVRLKEYLESQLAELGPSVDSRSRGELVGTIEQLQRFERNYRTRLKEYFESQLEELGQRGSARIDSAHKGPKPGMNVGEPDGEAAELRRKLGEAERALDSFQREQLETRAELDTLRRKQSDTEHELRGGDAALSRGSTSSQRLTDSLSSSTSTNTDVQASGVFISYRRDDERSFAGRLYDRLLSRFGEHQIFMDVDSIELGLDFTDVIGDRLEQTRVMLVVMGRKWLECSDHDGGRRLDNPDDFVRIEVETALARRDVRVIPVLVDEAAVPKSSDLPPSLSSLVRRNAIRMSHEGFGADFGRLINTLERVMRT